MNTETEVVPVEEGAEIALTQKSAFYWFVYWVGKGVVTTALWVGCFFFGFVGLVFLFGPVLALFVGLVGTVAIWAPNVLRDEPVYAPPVEKSAAYWLFYWMGKVIGTASLWIGGAMLGFLGIVIFIGPILGMIIIALGTIAIWSATVSRNNE